MKKKILFSLITVTLFLVIGCTQVPKIQKNDSSIINNSSTAENATDFIGNYSTEPIMECVDCVNGETWNNRPCCTDNFESDCLQRNGVIRWTDLHPVFTSLRGCFQKAPDTGKECASGSDCMSGVCDLESAIKSNRCNLIEKEPTGEKNQFGNEEFFRATYSCPTTKPGKCAQARRNRPNPGGVNHYFIMDGNILTEIQESGPIH